MCRCCSGPSASWSAAVSISSRCSRSRSGRRASGQLDTQRWYLRLALWSLPLPWLAVELGWIVAEYGRQPWAIEGILPTALGVSSVSGAQVLTSLGGFVLFYTALAIVDVTLMLKFTRKGPDGLGIWPLAGADPSHRPSMQD